MVNRLEKVRNILIMVLLLNIIVSFSKIIYGNFTDTLSMQADGYHSLFDGLSNVIGLIGVWIASRPPDSTHPYGYYKYETMASLAIALILAFVGFDILHNAIQGYLTGTHPSVTSLSFIVMLVTIAINLFVTTYEKKQGLLLKSEILVADSLHTRTDIYVSISVIAGLLAIRIGYPIIEIFVAFIIAICILGAGFSIVRESVCTLCDMSRIDGDSICSVVNGIEGVFECHRIRNHGTAGNVHVDLHIMVNPELQTYDSHAIADTVEECLMDTYEEITDVVVHIEPNVNN